ncbi:MULTISPECIES: M48 family metallopeptidase [Halomonadaceae]|uniref:M48 family metallopeptidase n=1 Tax=Halomonadaceae TaxID=28256 RepID=UPI001599DCD9|nr:MULTISPECIES: M48 family metallopeptidase [Halomonas]QJQ95324.1 M48 family metallopeptidase [Halomonas sp. PA5]
MAGGPVDFFGAQERAKRYTGRLILLMALALISLIVMASLAVSLVLVLADGTTGQGQQAIDAETFASALDPRLLGTTALAVLAVVVLGSLFKHMQLRAGGRAVAEAMGGRLLNVQTRDANERQILNIVEEMALASGTPVPAVYLIEDNAINAFAAGHSPQDAVIGMTRGAIELLDRDELQGVVAHEFSHILNGDMRLNLRLVALLHGLLLIGLIGHMVLRGGAMSSATRSRRDNSHAVMLALGAALMVVGYVGTLCGSLIKAAVSRQREFLADASAVQFTRQPEGIGGALMKIAAHQRGSQLQAANASEYSHFYFSRGVSASGPMSTHPPLETRIRRVLPNWNGELPTLDDASREARRTRREEAIPETSSGIGQGSGLSTLPTNSRALIASALATIGTLDQPHLEQARETLATLDDRLLEAAHDPFSARALAYGIMMGLEPGSRERQYALLRQFADPTVVAALGDLAEPLETLDPRHRLALLELAMPVLKQLSTSQYAVFKTCLGKLVEAERAPGAMQWALYRVLIQGVEGGQQRRREARLTDLEAPVALVISTMARAGGVDGEEARRACEAAQTVLPELSLTYQETPASFAELDRAMDRLLQSRQADRSRLLESLAVCIEHDGQVSVAEAELFRALADMFECPMPPLLAEHPPRES